MVYLEDKVCTTLAAETRCTMDNTNTREAIERRFKECFENSRLQLEEALRDMGIRHVTCKLTITYDREGNDNFRFYDAEGLRLNALQGVVLCDITFRNEGDHQEEVFCRDVRLFSSDAPGHIEFRYATGETCVLADRRSMHDFGLPREYWNCLIFAV